MTKVNGGRLLGPSCILTLNAKSNKYLNSKINNVCSGNHDFLQCKPSNYLFRCMMLTLYLAPPKRLHAGLRGRMVVIFSQT